MKRLILFSLMLSFVVFVSCTSNKEEKQEQKPAQEKAVNVKVDTVQTMAEEEKTPENINLLGTWTGTFDQRNTTLKITSQNGNDFEGSITINYREVINQKVKGSVNPETKTFTMTDQLHSRYAGSYSGKISDDGGKLSGTFTQNVDKTKILFNLKK
jgi:PBP1b-binding outer membrane lipoprotein LpoB